MTERKIYNKNNIFQKFEVLKTNRNKRYKYKAFKEYCDILCTIPMSENSYATSFNVSCAASIIMYEITRQRGMK